MKLCFASNNLHKIEEIQSLLGDSFELLSLEQIGCDEELAETGDTLEANSLQKAQYVWDNYHINCFADDTGLEVAALDGEPGVYSARYAGTHRNSQDNIQLLLQKLASKTDKLAQFRAIITLILEGNIHPFEGIVRGQIIDTQRGSGGFGYDPVFVPDGHDRTLAEMPLSEKNTLSHRAKAFQKLSLFLTSLS